MCVIYLAPFEQSLEDKDRKHVHQKDSLNREQRYLLRRLDQLRNSVPMNKRRSVSECSISTVSSTNSTAGSPSSLCEFAWPEAEEEEDNQVSYYQARVYLVKG